MTFELSWKQINPFGAEVVDLDLSQDQPEDVIDALRKLYDEHHLLVFRKQSLTLEEQRRATGWFGRLYPVEEGVHYISNSRKDGFLGNLELKFHSDLAYCEFPIEGITLHAVEVDEGNTTTKFTSAAKAWTALPEHLKEKVVNRRAAQAFAYGANDGRDWEYGFDEKLPHWSHRVARPHPRTGELCLYVMPESTRLIEGLPEQEGRPLLQALYDHIARAEAVYEHVWYKGDLVLWDNLACNHARGALDPTVPRTLQRQTLGPLTFKQQYSHLSAEAMNAITGRLGAEPG